MSPPARQAKDIFLEVVEIGPPEARAAFLERACAGDAELRRRVEALLAAHERPESLLDRPAPAFEPAATLPHSAVGPPGPAEGPGDALGPYRLIERLGEGGMGVVYRAEQLEPVRREVALKLIRPGMDSAQVLARFGAERQALELMDHPNIARVLDAGATPAGRPYFVMELVRGVPITGYCDEARLPPQRRLELFAAVCAAIQHAHQKGIIHRDIKPSNILVAEVDGRPVPKVIDFGVAKAIDPRRAERTMFTQHGAIVGTPEYMSPEQAGAEPDVDTRTDVYSLGVLLYELLTGTTPLDRETLRRAALGEVLRQVRELEPPKPSTRLSGSGDRLPSVAAVRGTEPARLTRLVRGDLDWVVMKALEKDRARRYETAAAFAADVRRHLDGDPVEAGPPSRTYRLRKFARKHRRGLAVAGAFVLVLVAATVLSTWQAVRATRAERLAEKRFDQIKAAQAATQAALAQSEESRRQAWQSSRFLLEAFRGSDRAASGHEVRAVDVLDQASRRVDREFAFSARARGAMLNALGESYAGLGLYDRALATYEKASATLRAALGPDAPETLASLDGLARAYYQAGQADRAIGLFESTMGAFVARLGPEHVDTLVHRVGLAKAHILAGRYDRALPLLETTYGLMEKTLGPLDPNTLACRYSLAAAYHRTGQVDRGIALAESSVRLMESSLGRDHPETFGARTNLAAMYTEAHRFGEAISMLESSLGPMAKALGADHPDVLRGRNNLASAYWATGRLDRSVPLFEQVLEGRRARLGRDHPETLNAQANLGVNYRDAGRAADGARLMRDALDRARGRSDAEAAVAWVRVQLAMTDLSLGRIAEAEALFRRCVEQARGTTPAESPALGALLAQLGLCLVQQAKWREAEPVLRESLAIREKAQPREWSTFSTRSQLGGCLLGQGKFAEAEPLIVAGYEGLKAREAKVPPQARARLTEAAERVVRLYEAWGKADQADAWRARLGQPPHKLPEDVFERP